MGTDRIFDCLIAIVVIMVVALPVQMLKLRAMPDGSPRN